MIRGAVVALLLASAVSAGSTSCLGAEDATRPAIERHGMAAFAKQLAYWRHAWAVAAASRPERDATREPQQQRPAR